MVSVGSRLGLGAGCASDTRVSAAAALGLVATCGCAVNGLSEANAPDVKMTRLNKNCILLNRMAVPSLMLS